MVQILASVVEAELALLEVEEERVRVHPTEPRHSGLGVAPEALDAVDVVAPDGPAAELAACVVHPQVPLVAHVHQAVVALEPVGVDHRAEIDFPSNRGQNRGFRAVLHHLGVDLPVPLADAEDDGLPSGAAAGLALDAAWSEVALVDLDVPSERPLQLARLGHAQPQAGQQAVDRVAVEARELRDLHGREVGGHMPQEPAENGLRHSSADDIAVSHWKTAYPGASGQAQLVMTLKTKWIATPGQCPPVPCLAITAPWDEAAISLKIASAISGAPLALKYVSIIFFWSGIAALLLSSLFGALTALINTNKSAFQNEKIGLSPCR